MMLKLKYGLLMLSLTIFFNDMHAQKSNPWKKGILVDEFIYDTAPFPECHAATIAETPKGLVIAFFGGTKERNPDVEIWISRRENNKWTAPASVANGIVNDTLRYPTWNPVL
jgi:alpha-L-rhamnosidase